MSVRETELGLGKSQMPLSLQPVSVMVSTRRRRVTKTLASGASELLKSESGFYHTPKSWRAPTSRSHEMRDDESRDHALRPEWLSADDPLPVPTATTARQELESLARRMIAANAI